MTSKEQYLELSELDSAYLPPFEKIRRRKPDWQGEETEINPPRLDARRASMPTLHIAKPLSPWLKFRELVEDWHEPIQTPILQMFVANNGPMAVAQGIKKELELVRSGNNVPSEITSYILIDAFGTTFERLVCYWLKITTEEPRKVLDVGSTQLLAHAFRRNLGIHIMPDGFIINDHDNPPFLETACEYKTNPTDPRSLEKLNRQLAQLVNFFTKFGDKTVYARQSDRFHLDRRAHWTVREIQIASRPSIMLVIPQDRDYEPPNEFVEVRKAPFSMNQLGRIVFTLMDDIHGMGFIKQELALLEERSQQELLYMV